MNPEVPGLPQAESIPDILPVLPLRETVVFPMAVAPLVIGQERSVRLVDDAMRGNRLIAVVAQRSPAAPAQDPADLYELGTVAVIHQLLRAPDGSMRLIVQGLVRVRLGEFVQTEPYFLARVTRVPESEVRGVEVEALSLTVRDLFKRLASMIPELPVELAAAIDALHDPREVVYQIASILSLSAEDRQNMLDMDSVADKLRKLIELLQHEVAVRNLEHRLAAETREQMTKAQKEYFLREHLRTIQRELGEAEGERSEIEALREKIEAAGMPEEARKEAERELSRLERMPEISPEYGMIRTYLDWMVTLPWSKTTGVAIDVQRAREVLDADHYDLDKIKERILEYLAVKKLRDERQAAEPENVAATQAARDESRHEPILCFIGAPGVGKTSLGQSIARAMGRKFVRISLGGIHDEAEIRGHRRTYIGAMPGRILQAIRRAGAADCIFMLDEVDKLGAGFQGDPSAALLEVLDPAQNYAFTDTYLGVPFDLSRVLFICTANNTATVPPPLLDRMEVLSLPGYTENEKLHIARRYLVPRAMKANGLREGEAAIDDRALVRIVREYTREAGVRNLERNIAGVLRKVARRITEGAQPPITVTDSELPSLLGPPQFYNEVAERIDRPGVATGLAWTPTGGDILFVESTMMRAREEKLLLTGMLGDVMRESAQAALSYLRANVVKLGFKPDIFDGKMVHVHVPAGAIPKDGPSAGVAIIVSLASLASGRPVRNDIAMTGEISLRGKVLRVGGIKEKVLAAHMAGVKQVILPKRNEPDLEDVPPEVRKDVQFVFVDSVEEALGAALVPEEVQPTAAPGPEAGEALPSTGEPAVH
ncbi:MAG: endopeptidase La [Myxococcales bacterium]|jgi:ATP-dependent Lon protease